MKDNMPNIEQNPEAFSQFFSSDDEHKKKVFTKVVQKANEDQRKVMELTQCPKCLTMKHKPESEECARCKETIDDVLKILVDEINICRQEGQPTSRLTSAYNRIVALNKIINN